MPYILGRREYILVLYMVLSQKLVLAILDAKSVTKILILISFKYFLKLEN